MFAELKAENGRVSAHQQVWLERLRAAGAEAHVWRPSQWVDVEAVLS